MTDNEITLIDAWELPEDRIDESIARWRERVGLIHAAPGFRDARLHRRLHPESRLGLINVAHWDSVEARDNDSSSAEEVVVVPVRDVDRREVLAPTLHPAGQTFALGRDQQSIDQERAPITGDQR